MINTNDYKKYLEENKKFLDLLSNNNSRVYEYFSDIFKVLGYIDLSYNPNNKDEDLEIIFESGFGYLYENMETVKIIFSKYFKNNYQKFSMHEALICYYLYLEDLLNTLEEDKKLTKELKKSINLIIESIENSFNKEDFNESELLEELDFKVSSLQLKNPPLTTQEVFAMVVEELDI